MNNRTLIERLYGRVSILELERAGEGDSVRPAATWKATVQTEKPKPKAKVRGEWIPLTQVDTKKGVRSIPPPIAIRFPDGSDTDIAGWNGIKHAIGDYLDVDKYTREQIARGQSRHDAMETARRIAGADADKFAIAFPVKEDGHMK